MRLGSLLNGLEDVKKLKLESTHGLKLMHNPMIRCVEKEFRRFIY
jgi:hypothetical protein